LGRLPPSFGHRRFLRDLLTAEPSAAALQALVPLLEQELRLRPIVTGLVGELKEINDRSGWIERGDEPWAARPETGVVRSALIRLVRPATRMVRARVLEYVHELMEYERLLPFEREARKLMPPSLEPEPRWTNWIGPGLVSGLVSAFLPQVPIDPCTGCPPEYKQAGSGFELRVKTPTKTSSADLLAWSVPR
jgi:hypothetical protein